jgi:hypothetical protein
VCGDKAVLQALAAHPMTAFPNLSRLDKPFYTIPIGAGKAAKSIKEKSKRNTRILF